MEWLHSVSPDFLDPFLLPLIIFFARITDVTVGTLRIVFLTQGRKRLAPLVGVIEVTVWLLAVSTVIQNVTEPLNFIAYVAGYSTKLSGNTCRRTPHTRKNHFTARYAQRITSIN